MIRKFLKNIYQLYIKIKRKDCVFECKTEFSKNCYFEGDNYISRDTFLHDTYIGYGTYFGYSCHIISTKVGKYCSIGPDVRVCIGKHPTREFVSTYPAFYSVQMECKNSFVNKKKYDEVSYAYINGNEKYAVYIGNDVWIGAGVRIADGVSIGNGAIIGANSLILQNVEPYSIVVGTPAKIIRKRFNDEQINFLLKLQWWNKDKKWLKKYGDCFENIDNLLETLNDETS